MSYQTFTNLYVNLMRRKKHIYINTHNALLQILRVFIKFSLLCTWLWSQGDKPMTNTSQFFLPLSSPTNHCLVYFCELFLCLHIHTVFSSSLLHVYHLTKTAYSHSLLFTLFMWYPEYVIVHLIYFMFLLSMTEREKVRETGRLLSQHISSHPRHLRARRKFKCLLYKGSFCRSHKLTTCFHDITSKTIQTLNLLLLSRDPLTRTPQLYLNKTKICKVHQARHRENLNKDLLCECIL